ncbi:MAG TPA: SIMPL domain-containing protein [Candidatus Limiplasma sp.]|nr:SIMPL domain-containing protein [Candidatus Limiplasma sp.]HRX09081.1 SIMPL domain-containing protein [Candidatus Limiplasma sp.]
MKKLLGILLVLMLIVGSASALAEGSTVTAIGSGTVTLVPDMASFSVGITTQDALITTAQTANAAAMQAVIAALTALNVAREDIQTEYYSVYPVYDYQGSAPKVTGYEVSNTVTVVVRDLASLPTLLDAAVEAGANNVYSLTFQSSEQNTAYEQALTAAAQDALRKAALMAQAIGREAGDPLSITENASSNVFFAQRAAYSLDSSYATPIENGMVTITAEVTAVVSMK